MHENVQNYKKLIENQKNQIKHKICIKTNNTKKNKKIRNKTESNGTKRDKTEVILNIN